MYSLSFRHGLYQSQLHQSQHAQPEHQPAQPTRNPSRNPLSIQYTFVQKPTEDDYSTLAQHVAAAGHDMLHSALWTQRSQVADGLRKMSEQPEYPAHLAAYQALRLLVW